MKHNDSLEHWPHFVRVRQTIFKSSPLQAGEAPYSLALEVIDGDTVPRADERSRAAMTSLPLVKSVSNFLAFTQGHLFRT